MANGVNGPEIRATVLYIEDNDPNVRVMESLLELRPHWHLISASLGGLGIDLAKAHRPDLVILDLHLPDRSGLDVIAALRHDPTLCRVPVAVLTADAHPHQRRRMLDAGADAYMTKPLDVDTVLDLLDSTARKKSDHVGPVG